MVGRAQVTPAAEGTRMTATLTAYQAKEDDAADDETGNLF